MCAGICRLDLENPLLLIASLDEFSCFLVASLALFLAFS